MPNKLSKSDLPDQPSDEFWASVNSRPETKHFAVGTRIGYKGEKGEIVDTLTCKCPTSETFLWMRWDSGRMSLIKPLALNNHARPPHIKE